MTYELGIVGAGNMAEAIVRAVIGSGVLQPSQIIAADVSPTRLELFTNQLGVRATDDGVEVARRSKKIVLSVKPQQMAEALGGMGAIMSPDTLVISIAAGITCGYIEKSLGGGKAWRVVRTMPNTPMMVGEGMVAMARGTHATGEDIAAARAIFETAAVVIELPEDKLDAVTALSGSGPAYFFYLVEQMIEAGVELGLERSQAHQLAAQTALGAATMLTESGDSPAELRKKVTSPGGTTAAAISHMEANGLGKIVRDALKAAALRSKELAK